VRLAQFHISLVLSSSKYNIQSVLRRCWSLWLMRVWAKLAGRCGNSCVVRPWFCICFFTYLFFSNLTLIEMKVNLTSYYFAIILDDGTLGIAEVFFFFYSLFVLIFCRGDNISMCLTHHLYGPPDLWRVITILAFIIAFFFLIFYYYLFTLNIVISEHYKCFAYSCATAYCNCYNYAR
jgi:hypothetical protein